MSIRDCYGCKQCSVMVHRIVFFSGRGLSTASSMCFHDGTYMGEYCCFLIQYMSLLVNAIIILMFSDAAGALCRITVGETKLSDTQNTSSCFHSKRAGDIVLIRVHVVGFLIHDLCQVPFEIITVMIVRHVLRIGTHGGKHVIIGIAICILRSFCYSTYSAKAINVYST